MWSGNFRNLHAYASLILSFFSSILIMILKENSNYVLIYEQTIHVFDYFI